MDDNEKINALSGRIRQAESEGERRDSAKPDGYATGYNTGIEFIGAVAVSGIIGALADRAFGTAPWCLLGMILAGFALGLYVVWRSYQKPQGKE